LKPLSAFPRDRSKADGYGSRCKVCDQRISKAQYAAKVERRKALAKLNHEIATAGKVRLCIRCGEPVSEQKNKYCDACKPAKVQHEPSGSTTQRGYGHRHVKERRRVAKLIKEGGQVCSRCGGLLPPDILSKDWALDHTEDRTGYLGPAHKDCNIKAAQQPARRNVRRRSRDW
jgi:hypothetical protein